MTEVAAEQDHLPLERGLRVLRLRLIGIVKDYEVDFRRGGGYRDLGIVAGRINTGKTSVLRFIDYALGADSYPVHAEVVRQVRAVALEIDTSDGLFTLERALGAKEVNAYRGPLEEADPVQAIRLPLAPPSDPQSISQWLLTSVGLQDVQLKEAPSKDESGTDRMSFRDLMWTVLFLNERVGSPQLLHAGNWMKELKLQQVVDAIFDVHDNEQADLARRIRDARGTFEAARHALTALEEFVAQQETSSLDALEMEADRLDRELAQAAAEIRVVTARERASADFASNLRAELESAALASGAARARLRDRRSLIDRFATLRAQYADDMRKLTLVVEADHVFDQLSVDTCPACLAPVEQLKVEGESCGLCHRPLAARVNPDSQRELVRIELQSARRRFKDLDAYWQGLLVDLPALEESVHAHSEAETTLAARVDNVTREATSPFVAQREQLHAERQALLVLRNSAAKGIKLLNGLEARRSEVDRLGRSLRALQDQQRSSRDRPDKDVVIAKISQRFGDILREIRYPKIEQHGELPPFIDDKLVPHVRGLHFKEASSGGQVLVSIAWMLAIFELGYELHAAHPGILMIDTFQKNLGGKADDEEFADIRIVERLYAHITGWLSGVGRGAQVIIVDNTPPDAVESSVVVRYTRNPDERPFGLIDNETGAADEVDDE